jgi:hypothetical protein
LQFGSRAPPVGQLDDHGNASELNSLGALLGVSLGKVCHARITMP